MRRAANSPSLSFLCSIAGLLAARVCHDHFERVVIVEAEGWLSTQDAWPDDVSKLPRRRTRLIQWDSYQSIVVTSISISPKPSNDFRKPSRSGVPHV